MKTDPRIDAYIANAAPFAQPILARLRALVHEVLPGSEETIKWGMPHFILGGKNVAGMAAFKAHCSFVIHGDGRQDGSAAGKGMGQFGKIRSLDDLPPAAELRGNLLAAAERIASVGSAVKTRTRAAKPEIATPDDLAAALVSNPAARATFDGLAPSYRREYLDWITGAKRAETRSSRIAQATEWLAQGKKRNWQYDGC